MSDLHAQMIEFTSNEITKALVFDPPAEQGVAGSRLSALVHLEMVKRRAIEDWQRYCDLYATPSRSRPKRYSGNAHDRRKKRRAEWFAMLKRCGLR